MIKREDLSIKEQEAFDKITDLLIQYPDSVSWKKLGQYLEQFGD